MINPYIGINKHYQRINASMPKRRVCFECFPFVVYSHPYGNYEITKGQQSVFLQGGEGYLMFDELQDLMLSHDTKGTRASRFSRYELFDMVCGQYFD